MVTAALVGWDVRARALVQCLLCAQARLSPERCLQSCLMRPVCTMQRRS
jgi:hypothetical protein